MTALPILAPTPRDPAAVRLPRAVNAATPAPTMSERYQFVDTRAIVQRFAEEGWQLAAAQVASPSRRDGAYAKHSLDFRHPELAPMRGTVPRILVINSHDGTSAARVMGGAYRFVCSNGLVIGTTFAAESVRHIGDAAADLIHRMRALARNTERLYTQIDRWANKDLTRAQRAEFARFAAHLRWGDAGRFNSDEVLQVRRVEDDAGDLWSTFNRVQENTIRGGLTGLSRSGRAATSRPLVEITRSAEYNAQLWRLAEEVAEFW